MLISYRRKFIFIHVPKVAGMSISKALGKFAFRPELYPWNRWLRRRGRPSAFPFLGHKIFPEHATAAQLASELPVQVCHRFFKFAFVRNPWDLQVSLYHYILRNKQHRQHERVASLGGFEQFLESVTASDPLCQASYLTGSDGALLVDFVGRYERLAEDFQTVTSIIGVNRSLPHVNGSAHRDYRSYYNERTEQIVRDVFRRDIDLFGYDFDGTGSSRRNELVPIHVQHAA
jgi:hypothetical protein